MQLSKNCTIGDLRDFFKTAGKVREVRLIGDRRGNSKRTKGIAYVEFREVESVAKAMLQSGQLVCGVPIVVMLTQAEKNRLAALKAAPENGPKRVFVANISPTVTREQLIMVFEPFGKVRECHLTAGAEGGPGQASIVFEQSDAAIIACEQLSGHFISGMNIRCALNPADLAHVGDRPALATAVAGEAGQGPTRFLVLRYMFNPAEETEEDWDVDIRDEILEECSKKHGPIVHIFVDKTSQGCVYIKFQEAEAAAKAQAVLHGKMFTTRQVIAEFLTESAYVQKCPEAAGANTVLTVDE